MDGLLFDTEQLCCEAWRTVSRDSGYLMDDALFFACVGHNTKDTRKIVIDSCGPDFPFDTFNTKARTWIRKRMEENGPPEKPGIRPLFDYLKSRNIPIALATSTTESTARWMIERAGLTDYFSAWAFGSEVEHGKPAPDIFLLAQKRLKVKDATCCAVFEDSPAGLESALAAGMKPVFIRDMIEPDPMLLGKIWKRAGSLDEASSDLFFADM